MEKKDLLKKQELAEELGMKFDEVSELFSEETMSTMRMVNTVGGSDDDSEGNFICPNDNCGTICINVTNCGKKCEQSKPKGSCSATIAPPDLDLPTIAPITSAPPVFPSKPANS